MSVRIVKGRRWRKRELIEQTMAAMEKLYPDMYNWLLQEMPKLKAVSKPSYVDPKGRVTHVKMKVPTIPWLFLQQLDPDWGKDSEDLELFTRICSEMNGAATPQEGRNRLYIPKEAWEKIEKSKKEAANAEEEKEAQDPAG
jgi:hypothetical protein